MAETVDRRVVEIDVRTARGMQQALQRTADSVRERMLFDEDRGLSGNFPERRIGHGDNRHSGRHRFEHRQAEALVAARLDETSSAAIDVGENNGQIGRRSAGGHIARVLFVSGRVGNDELALVGGKKTIGDINRNSLLALRGKAIDQESEVEVAALSADAFALGLQTLKLIVEQEFALVEQASDQCGLAIINAAGRTDAEKA